MRPRALGQLLCLLGCAVVSSASVLTFNETSFAGGDFPGAGFPNVGTLGVGVNTVTGSVNGSPDQASFTDFEDTFGVTLPAGLIITSGQWSITSFTFGPGPNGNNNGSVNEPVDGSKAVSSNGTLPLSNVPYSISGSLNVDIQSASAEECVFDGDMFECAAGPGGFNYTLQYTVAASPAGTPEPMSLLLTGIGMVTLAARKYLSR